MKNHNHVWDEVFGGIEERCMIANCHVRRPTKIARLLAVARAARSLGVVSCEDPDAISSVWNEIETALSAVEDLL